MFLANRTHSKIQYSNLWQRAKKRKQPKQPEFMVAANAVLFGFILFSHWMTTTDAHKNVLVWCEIICSMLWRIWRASAHRFRLFESELVGSRHNFLLFVCVFSFFYFQNDKFSAFMVFGLIGGLRHLMWFAHASEPANLKILFEIGEQSKMQALHGSLNFCARDCGYRCGCMGDVSVYECLKPKPLQTPLHWFRQWFWIPLKLHQFIIIHPKCAPL